MPEIVLTTLNARYAHASSGLRYLLANLGSLQDRATLLEFDINQRSADMLEAILDQKPRIVGIGVYIWNVEPATRLVADLKRLRPDIVIVLGGPEVSYETDPQDICQLADYVITGEADLAFAQLCESLLQGRRPPDRIIPAALPQFQGGSLPNAPTVQLPYHLYTDTDIRQRVIYVEASRGCPFQCEFCLSSLDIPVRNVPLDDFLAAMQRLLDRGAKQFKFVDRTFNLNLNIGSAILRFFLDRLTPDLFLHFEMIPDRLPTGLKELIARFPPGVLQFEVGIQTFNEATAARISRRQDNAKVEENLRWLREHSGVHVHADLIAGLPGEDLAMFAAGFDRLLTLEPQEIQVGILKRLRGAPIARHDQAWQMVYSTSPPYEVLQTSLIDFAMLQRIRRFARYWDLVANSGNFIETTLLLCQGKSAFDAFMVFSDWLFARTGISHGIALQNLARHLFDFLVAMGRAGAVVAPVIWRDYQRGGRSDRPAFLEPYVSPADTRQIKPRSNLPARQARHLIE